MIGKPVRPRPAKWPTRAPNGARMQARIHDANFYALPFASQMIVWAMRKRLNALAAGASDQDDVLHIFHMADWGDLYAALLTLADIVVNAALHGGLVLHAVTCPCLARHEGYLLNALAYLQNDRSDEAILSLCEIVAPAGARLAVPHLKTIARDVSEQNLRFAYVDLSTLAPKPRAPSSAGSPGRAH